MSDFVITDAEKNAAVRRIERDLADWREMQARQDRNTRLREFLPVDLTLTGATDPATPNP